MACTNATTITKGVRGGEAGRGEKVREGVELLVPDDHNHFVWME